MRQKRVHRLLFLPVLEEAMKRSGEMGTLLRTFSALMRISEIESGGRHGGFAKFDLATTIKATQTAVPSTSLNSGTHYERINCD